MPDLDDDLVDELREQLDAAKKHREELIEELRASRKQTTEPGSTGVARGRSYYEEAAREKAREKGGDDE